MARQIVVFALVLIALVGMVSAAGSKASTSPAPAPGDAAASGGLAGSPGGASSPPSSAPSPGSGVAALEVSTVAGVGVAFVAGYFMF
ncbi:anther-specific protein BCP1 [Hibiscus syriacus]|uniref:anther-specific protein BCP1 n=1 Tax=Hibiscus syriacus TaxID=106335 RepID=UPI001921A8BF|nr:anther-specific protein BCP1 [Hibiscus syriacus]